MLPVEDDWPEFWDQVRPAVIAVGSTLDAYRSEEHPHVLRVFSLDWELLEPLVDGDEFAHIRFRIFDAANLAYRFRIVGFLTSSRSVRLAEFQLYN